MAVPLCQQAFSHVPVCNEGITGFGRKCQSPGNYKANGTQSKPGKVFNCSADGCYEVMESMQFLVKHLRIHHKPNHYYKCETCLERFGTHLSMVRHTRLCLRDSMLKAALQPLRHSLGESGHLPATHWSKHGQTTGLSKKCTPYLSPRSVAPPLAPVPMTYFPSKSSPLQSGEMERLAAVSVLQRTPLRHPSSQRLPHMSSASPSVRHPLQEQQLAVMSPRDETRNPNITSTIVPQCVTPNETPSRMRDDVIWTSGLPVQRRTTLTEVAPISATVVQRASAAFSTSDVQQSLHRLHSSPGPVPQLVPMCGAGTISQQLPPLSFNGKSCVDSCRSPHILTSVDGFSKSTDAGDVSRGGPAVGQASDRESVSRYTDSSVIVPPRRPSPPPLSADSHTYGSLNLLGASGFGTSPNHRALAGAGGTGLGATVAAALPTGVQFPFGGTYTLPPFQPVFQPQANLFTYPHCMPYSGAHWLINAAQTGEVNSGTSVWQQPRHPSSFPHGHYPSMPRAELPRQLKLAEDYTRGVLSYGAHAKDFLSPPFNQQNNDYPSQ
uniref:C2H2-type domain-containing protein n=1 Tax=Eptatretus burgeri TaxID=7764 RepID=A0A8C4N3T5_EPTBU